MRALEEAMDISSTHFQWVRFAEDLYEWLPHLKNEFSICWLFMQVLNAIIKMQFGSAPLASLQ